MQNRSVVGTPCPDESSKVGVLCNMLQPSCMLAAGWQTILVMNNLCRWILDQGIQTRTEMSVCRVRHARSPRSQKICQNPCQGKLMVIVGYDVRGVIVCHFVPLDRTVTKQFYMDFLVQQIWCDIWDKRLDLVDSAMILCKKARTHKAESVVQLLWCWG